MWKALKKLNNNHSSLFSSLEYNNICADTDKERSNMLNDYFSECWNNSEPPLSSQIEDVASNNDTVSAFDFNCSEEQVLHLLQKLNVGR